MINLCGRPRKKLILEKNCLFLYLFIVAVQLRYISVKMPYSSYSIIKIIFILDKGRSHPTVQDMPKNKGKGGKNRRRGKNENEGAKRELILKEEGQERFLDSSPKRR